MQKNGTASGKGAVPFLFSRNAVTIQANFATY